jgi:hypothetical protein
VARTQGTSDRHPGHLPGGHACDRLVAIRATTATRTAWALGLPVPVPWRRGHLGSVAPCCWPTSEANPAGACVRPQVVHRGGNLVDGAGVDGANFVDNSVGARVHSPYGWSCPKGPTEARSGGDRLKTVPPGWPRSPQGRAGATTAITSTSALSGFFGRFVHQRRVAREGGPAGRPAGRDRHPGVGTPGGRRSLTGAGGAIDGPAALGSSGPTPGPSRSPVTRNLGPMRPPAGPAPRGRVRASAAARHASMLPS